MVQGIYFQPSSAQQTLGVIIPTTLTLNAPSSVNGGASFQVTGVLTANPGGGTPIAGETIQIVFQSQTQNVVTDANGNYVATLVAPAASGSYLVTADFLGVGGYQGSSAQATVTVSVTVSTTLTLTLSATTVAPGQAFTASGALTRDDTGAGVSGQPVVLAIDGATATTVNTDSNGNYSASLTAPSAAGNHTVSASFAGADPPADALTFYYTSFQPTETRAQLGSGSTYSAASIAAPVALALLFAGFGVVAVAANRRRR